MKTRNVRLSESLHRKAARLLTSCGLLQILRKYGEIRPWGSYAANLMMNEDIDFHVVCKRSSMTRKVLKAYTEIALTHQFEQQTRCDWYNEFKRSRRRIPGLRGYYLILETRRNKVKWKIDVWFLEPAEQAKDDQRFNVLNMSISAKQRETILAFKKLRNESGILFSSQRIYELVLVEGVTSRTTFKQFLAKEKRK